jgi:hypothetical protein
MYWWVVRKTGVDSFIFIPSPAFLSVGGKRDGGGSCRQGVDSRFGGRGLWAFNVVEGELFELGLME